MKLLIADSLTGNLGWLRRAYQKKGHKVITVQTGRDALAELSNGHQFDIVIVDLDLLGPMQGPELIKLIRRNFPDLPWLMTGASHNDLVSDKERFVLKPMTAEELLQVAEKTIKGH